MAVDLASALTAGLITFATSGRWVVAVVIPAAWVFSLAIHHAYQQRFLGTGTEEFRRIMRATVLTAFAACCSWWLVQRNGLLHDMIFAIPITAGLTVILRQLLRLRLHASWAAGRAVQRALFIGHGTAVAELVATLQRRQAHGLETSGICLPEPSDDSRLAELEVPVFTGTDDITAAVRRCKCDVVVVLPYPELDGTALRRMCWDLHGEGVEVLIAPVLCDLSVGRMAVRPTAGVPLVHVRAPQLSHLPRIPKEIIDRTAALLGIVVLLPLLLTIAVLVKTSSPGSILFRQTRVGRYGETFTVLKFRTMYRDAERRKHELAHLNHNKDGLLFKMRHDPRVTPLGRVLRRYSLDELPQLFNVAGGTMSLVGPRPPLPEEVLGYSEDVRRRLLVKPGLTGLWQVSGRSDLPWEEAIRLDLSYVENWSAGLDAAILLKTTSAVVKGTGAY